MRRRAALAGALAVIATAAALPSTASAAASCASRLRAGGRTRRPVIRHVIVIVMENRSYVAGDRATRRSSPALANRCGLATNYHAITHPSLPNYLAMTSGEHPRHPLRLQSGPVPGAAARTCSPRSSPARAALAQLRRVDADAAATAAPAGCTPPGTSRPSTTGAIHACGRHVRSLGRLRSRAPALRAALRTRAGAHVRDAEPVQRHARLLARARRPVARRAGSR